MVTVVDVSVVNSLKKLAKHSPLVVISMIFYYVSLFIFRLFLARGLEPEEYGSIAFSITLSNVATVLALLGIPLALPRQIASARFKKEDSGLVAAAGLLVVLVSSIFISILLVLLSYKIANVFSGVSSDILIIFSFIVFFNALLRASVGIARGYEDIFVFVVFHNTLYGVFLIISAFFAGVVLQNSFLVALLSLLSVAMVSILSLLFIIHKGYVSLVVPSLNVVSTILAFSLPLFVSAFISAIFGGIDVFMVGYFFDSTAVGVYNVALTIVKALLLFLTATSYLYLPIASSMASSGDVKNLKRFYQIITKWIVVFTLPLFAVVVLYPNVVISLFFGREYLGAAASLAVLALAYLVHTSLGANGWTLIALGETRFIFFCTVASAIVNFVLNAVLIPVYGILGAAFATAVSLIFVNCMASAFLYKKYGIHPFTKHYFIPFFAAFVPLLVLKFLGVSVGGILDLVWILFEYFLVYGILLTVLRIFEREDIEILRSILQRASIF